jgi:hypothetical protein
MVISKFILNVFTLALIMRSSYYLPYYWVLHNYACKFTDVCCSRFIVFMGKTMGICIVRWLQA